MLQFGVSPLAILVPKSEQVVTEDRIPSHNRLQRAAYLTGQILPFQVVKSKSDPLLALPSLKLNKTSALLLIKKLQ